MGRDSLSLNLIGACSAIAQASLFIQSCSECTWFIAAIIICAIGILVDLFLLFAEFNEKCKQSITKPCTVILFINWLTGVIILTVYAPFVTPGNGYFGTWIAFITSFWMLTDVFMAGSSHRSGNEGSQIMVASFAVLTMTVVRCYIQSSCGDAGTYSIVFSSVSFVFALLLQFPACGSKPALVGFMALFFLIWWAVGWFMLTFIAPFRYAGNGYFGCSLAFMASCNMFNKHWGSRNEKISNAPPYVLTLIVACTVVLVAGTFRVQIQAFYEIWIVVESSVGLAIGLFFMTVSCGCDCAVKAAPYVAPFNLVWWIVGVFITTTYQPSAGLFSMSTTISGKGNVYFASWLALIASWFLCIHFSETFRRLLGDAGHYSFGTSLVVLASLVMLTQLAVDVINVGSNYRYTLGFICAGISLLLALLTGCMAKGGNKESLVKIFVLLLVIIWSVAVAMLTFDYPYTSAGNSYFAAWCSFFLSISMLSPQSLDRMKNAIAEKE